VQGVGFRPFIYRLAHESGLKGWVNNTNENIQVMINSDPDTLRAFIDKIQNQAPPASRIESIESEEVEGQEFKDFRIIESENLSDAVTEVSPDIAVCDACLKDMKQQANRIDYPFLNCTNCGPRFTIIRDLPYDRKLTSMQEFEMCKSCRDEFETILDRRFHAQPTACRDCGPEYSLVEGSGSEAENGSPGDIIERTARILDEGGIVAVKGLGGFFMACDAMNESAVSRLRNSKQREGKPFAVMFRSLKKAADFCRIHDMEAECLSSWRRPIIIAQNLPDAPKKLAPSVSNGFPTTGIMLPYMPFHYLLFERLKASALVMTSGNLSEEPILIDNKKAESILGAVSDAVLHYNREIHNRCDDSVGLVINENPRLLRRSRGYVPSPVRTCLETEGIFAAGAELVNCFAMGKGSDAIMSQHIGDLKNFETYEFYRETFDRFTRLFRLEPELVAHDMHPDYLSTRFAAELELKTMPVQHHHAHIASVLAEHKLDEKVIGVSFDGTGLGDDGNIWGSEFLVCDLNSFERIAHLEYMPMPGGDKAAREPWRMAISCLYSAYGNDFVNMQLPFLSGIKMDHIHLVLQSIEKKINCPLTSGAGRFFDAVSAILGFCSVSLFHAEAPMRLEASVHQGEQGTYFAELPGGLHRAGSIGTGTIIRKIVEDIGNGIDPGRISARFHNTISDIILDTVIGIHRDQGIKKVALSGGTFQNKYLSERIENQLEEKGFEVLIPLQLPANDGGIALGQLAIAAKKRSLGIV
jgi:hydrogenase maturation protein HypF